MKIDTTHDEFHVVLSTMHQIDPAWFHHCLPLVLQAVRKAHATDLNYHQLNAKLASLHQSVG